MSDGKEQIVSEKNMFIIYEDLEEINLLKRFKHLYRYLSMNRMLFAGIGIISVLALLGLLAPLIAPYPAMRGEAAALLQPPSIAHLMGTDNYGMDIFSRVIYAARVDLMVAFISVFFGTAIGIPVGAISGFFSGIVDNIIMRILDGIQSFPIFIFAIIIVALTQKNITSIVLAITFLQFPTYARLVRSRIVSEKENEYVTAAVCSGKSDLNIVFSELLPNCIGPVFPQASINAGYAILMTAGLSFIGVGVEVPTPEWGSMIYIGASNLLSGEWWTSFFPGMVMAIAVLGFNLIGDGLHDAFDPTKSGKVA
jgi:peptide/nickel transport system permease protein